jgi:uncharacterized protein involved in copper resistance
MMCISLALLQRSISKMELTMRHQQRTFLCGFVIAFLILLAACGGKETMASKSAAAYRQAKANGTPVSGGHEHGGHAVEGTVDHSTMTDTSGMDHSTMTGMDHSQMGSMDHSKMDHSKMTGTDHSKMTAADHSMAGMDHSTTAADHSSMAGMDHSDHSAMPGMHHGAASPAVAVAMPAPRSSVEMARVDPGATLQADAFDAPAPASVAEAAKAAGAGDHAGHSMNGPEAAVVYTCPMHPEVRSATPGQCPKCGMTLVRAAAGKEK